MLKKILSIAGRPGLYKLVNQGKNMLIVESLTDHKRIPAYSRDKVLSLGDITMYTYDNDTPLPQVLHALKEKQQGQPVDISAIGDLREFFGEVLPNFDRNRVHTSDIRRLIAWYNMLVEAGETAFIDETAEEAPATEEAPAE